MSTACEEHPSGPGNMIKRHEYEPFPAGQTGRYIRLFHLLPKSETDPYIRGRLSQHALLEEDCPSFHALSYVWGDPTAPGYKIICDEQIFVVTANLHDALVALRGNAPLYLWIDQICINQNNLQEKSFQIPLMRQIYSRAVKTIAWLGDGDYTTKMAFEVLHEIAQNWREYLTGLVGKAQSDSAELRQSDSDPSNSSDISNRRSVPTRDESSAAKRILENPWFTRVWIIQEVACSTDLIMQSSSHTISFDHLLTAMWGFLRSSNGMRANIINGGAWSFPATLAGIRHQYRSAHIDGLSIVQLIAHCRQYQATNDRDQVYALYGICSTTTIHALPQPNYALPVARALGEAMVHMMRAEGSLRLLELSDSSSEASGPSWIVRTRTTRDPRIFPNSSLHNNFATALEGLAASICTLLGADFDFNSSAMDNEFVEVFEPMKAAFKIDRNLPHTSEFHQIILEDDLKLVVSGQRLDQIEELSPCVLLPAGFEKAYGSARQDSSYFQDLKNIGKNDGPDDIASVVPLLRKYATNLIGQSKEYVDDVAQMDLMIMSRQNTAYYRSREHISEAYRFVVFGGQTENDVSAKTREMTEQDISKLFHEWRESLQSSAFQLAEINDIVQKAFDSMVELDLSSLQKALLPLRSIVAKPMQEQLASFMAPLFGRRMAWTVKGHLALVPARTEEHDDIFYLQGSEMPFVLRSLENRYWKLIGPAYIDGMMGGELYNKDCFTKISIA